MITGRENMQYLVYLSKTPEEAAKKKGKDKGKKDNGKQWGKWY